MELCLDLGPSWRAEPGGWMSGELILTYGTVGLDFELECELPDGSRVLVQRETTHATRHGWPLQFCDADVVGATTEARLYACYTFLAHVAVAVVRAPVATAIEARRAELVAIFESGRPDFRGDPICLAEAWDMAADPAIPAAARDHHARAIAHGERGEHVAAAEAWERAIEVAPDFIEAHYNLGQVRYLLGDFVGALASFERSAIHDALYERNVIQCLHALGRDTDAVAARDRFRIAWSRSRAPRIRNLAEVVIDQFASGGVYVRVFESLPSWRLTFHANEAAVVVERSADGFAVSLHSEAPPRVLATHASLPPYTQLKAEIVPLLIAAVSG